MSLIPINLAIEDELSEVVLLKLLASSNRYAVGSCFRRGGYGYLKKTIDGWNKASKSIPFVILTDLDKSECPIALLEQWLTVPRNSNLLFRVAVREVESWLLADRVNFSTFSVRLEYIKPVYPHGAPQGTPQNRRCPFSG